MEIDGIYIVTEGRSFPNEDDPYYMDHAVEDVTVFSTREGAENYMESFKKAGIFVGFQDGDPCYKRDPDDVGCVRLRLEEDCVYQ